MAASGAPGAAPPIAAGGGASVTGTGRPRSTLRAVALPTEHGGWGLTLEPILLGLAVAPSLNGLGIGIAALLAFVARTPLKLSLVDARRGRRLRRTVLARRVLAIEIGVVALCVAGPVATLPGATWWPLLGMAPLLAVELWFDMRSRSRRLAPELCGAIGIAGVVALIALAGGESVAVAVALWAIIAARAVTSIVTVRDQVGRIHGRPGRPRHRLRADVVALALAAAAVVVEPAVALGGVAVAVVMVVQRLLDRPPLPRAVVLGLRQTALGLGVVAASAVSLVVV